MIVVPTELMPYQWKLKWFSWSKQNHVRCYTTELFTITRVIFELTPPGVPGVVGVPGVPGELGGIDELGDRGTWLRITSPSSSVGDVAKVFTNKKENKMKKRN